jgi:hypothetical protein
MSGPRNRGKANNQRAQVAVAAVLCLALGGVWWRAWRQMGADADPADTSGEFAQQAQPPTAAPRPAQLSPQDAPRRQGGSSPVAALAAADGSAVALPRAWPTADWEALLATDPLSFVTTTANASSAAEAATDAGASAEAPWERRLATEDAVVLVAGGQKRLLLGDNEYRVGDRVGSQIIADITAGEIVLAPE